MPTWPLMAVVLVVMILVLYEGWNVPPRYWGQASSELPKKNKSRLARFQYRQPNNDLSGGQLKQVLLNLAFTITTSTTAERIISFFLS